MIYATVPLCQVTSHLTETLGDEEDESAIAGLDRMLGEISVLIEGEDDGSGEMPGASDCLTPEKAPCSLEEPPSVPSPLSEPGAFAPPFSEPVFLLTRFIQAA